MSSSISSALSTAPLASANSYSAPAAAKSAVQNTPQSVQSANDLADTVQLSAAQQVYQLYNQGQPISQIASNLSLPVDTVDNYLGITAAKLTPLP